MALTMKPSLINSKKREKPMKHIENMANAFGKKYELKIHFSGLPFKGIKYHYLYVKN